MADATVKIPAQYADAFYREAVATLAFAADNLEEGARWWTEGRKPKAAEVPYRLEEEDIPRVLDAISLVERARNGVAEYGAEELVKSTIEGLVLDLGEKMHGLAENRSKDELREAMAELEVWLALLESEPMQEVEREREKRLKAFREREAVA